MTVQEILEAAYAKSTKNNPGTIATESTELLGVVQRSLDGLFAVAARINPTHFGVKETVNPTGGTHWLRPEGAESIFRIEDTVAGTEVVIVAYDDKDAEAGKAAVYEYGQQFYPSGNASDPDPATDDLDFFYSKQPDTLADEDATLDALWEEQFNELIIIDVALYLAVKDGDTEGRAGEVQALMDQREQWGNRYMAFLEHSTVGVRKRWGHVNRFNAPSLVPISSVLGISPVGQTK